MSSEIKNYGVWACNIVKYKIETAIMDSKSPHITLTLKDNDNGPKTAAINIKSTDKTDTDLIYWFNKDFQYPLTQSLKDLDLGFYLAKDSDDGRFNLDFVRTTPSLININDGQELPHDVPGPDNDIIKSLQPIIEEAKTSGAVVYIFGSRFDDARASGIHDIHMNQGSLPRYDNGLGTDGAMIFKFPDGHFEAVFLAFATQRIPTDERGEPMRESKTLSEIVANKSWVSNDDNDTSQGASERLRARL